MSAPETPPPPPSADPSPGADVPPSAGAPPAPAARRERARAFGRGLWRWSKRIVLALVVLVLVVRIALPLALPGIVARIGRAQGLAIRYGELRLALHRGEASLTQLDIRPLPPEGADGGNTEPLLRAEFIDLDVDFEALLGGRVHLRRAVLDGVTLRIEREADGRWQLARLFASDAAAEAEESEPAPREEEPAGSSGTAPIDFSAPLRIDAARLQHVKLLLIDRTEATPLDTELLVDVRVSDLGVEGSAARFHIDARSKELLHRFRVEGTFRGAVRTLDASLELALDGFTPKPLAGMLGAIGLEPLADVVDARLGLTAHADALEGSETAVHAAVRVERVALHADFEEAMALDSLEVDVPHLAGDRVDVARVAVHGVRGAAQRRADGALVAAGFALLPASAGAGGVGESEASAATDAQPPPPPRAFTLAELLVEAVALRFHDEAVAPATELALELDSLRLVGLARDAAQPDAEAVLTVRGRAAGLAESLTLDAKARPFAAQRTFELRMAAKDLDGKALAPYLAPSGLAPDFEGGQATLALQGSVEKDAAGARSIQVVSEGLALDPGSGRPAFALGTASVTGVEVAADGGTLRIGGVTLALERAELERDEHGVIRAFGLRTLTEAERAAVPAQPVARARPTRAQVPASETPTAADAAAQQPAKDEALAPARAPTRFEIGLAKLDAGALHVKDNFTPRPVEIALSEFGLELRDLALGGDPARTEPDRATLSVRLASEGIAEELALNGSLTSKPGPLDVVLDLDFQGTGLVTREIDPWLTELGVESTLVDGHVQLALHATAAATEEGTRVAAGLTEVAFRDGASELLALDALEVDEVVVGDGFTRLGTVALRAPRLAIARDADGAVRALGVRIPARAEAAPSVPGESPGQEPAPPAPARRQPTTPSEAAEGGAEGEAPAAADADAPPPKRFSLARLSIEDLRCSWTDAQPSTEVATALVLSGSLEDMRLGEDSAPARFDVDFGIEGSFDSLRLAGECDLSGAERALHATVTGTGLREGPLAPYLPPNVAVSLTDGRLAGQLDAVLGPAAAGGQSLRAEITDVSLREGEHGEALAGLKRLLLDVPRFDGSAGVYEVADLSTEGLVLDVVRTGPVTYETFGVALTLAAAPAPEGAAAQAAVPPEPAAPAAPAVPVEAATSEQAAGAQPGTAPVAAAPQTLVVGLSGVANQDLPTVDIARLSLGIDRIRFVDRTAGDAVPLELNAHLVLPKATRLLAPDPETLEPLVLELAGAAPPFVRAASVQVTFSPFAPTVRLTGQLDVRGISGPGLVSVMPSLAERVELSGLVDGRISGKLDATLGAQRRGPAAFDLSRGLNAVVEVADLGMRATEGGPVLLGVERIFVDAPRMRPGDGDYSIRTVEVTRPIFHARKTSAGLELGGVVLRNAPPAAAPTVEVSATEAAPQGAAPPQPLAGPAEPPSGPFASIGELLISGIELHYEDSSVTPAMVVPLTDLDLELRGFSTRPGGVITLRAFAEAGEVTLPERVQGDSLVSGLIAAAAGVVTGRTDTYRSEQRRVWETLSVSARVSAGEGAPRGQVTVDVEGFELQTLRGLAKASGVEISDGLVETHLKIRLLGERGLKLETRTTFSHLFVSEPEGGPISKYLALPAPLDSVLYVLRDEREQQVIPLTISVPPEGMSTSSILGVVSVTLGQLIAQSLAKSPLRIGSGALGLLGLLREKEAPPLGAPLVLSFEPLDGALDEHTQRVLADVAADVLQVPGRKLRLVHELGTGDVKAADAAMQLAPASLGELGEVLFGTREALAAERDVLAAAVRGHLAVGRLEAAEQTRKELVQLEERAAETESALDQVYGLMRTGVTLNKRRARLVAIVLGDARLTAVQRALVQAGLSADRVELRRPRGGPGVGTGGGRVLVEQR